MGGASIFNNVNNFLTGGDYNPDQWLNRPDILQQDAQLMQKLGINAVSLGIFAWATLEPDEGNFQFDWLDQTIERLDKVGVHVILATPTAARPMWLGLKYPDVCITSKDGKREYPKLRHNFCWTSDNYRDKSAIIIDKLAERYASCDTVIGWHINNEYGGHADWAHCYCDSCITNFQHWLKQRYDHDIDKLNDSWWTRFWSHTYQSWDQIRPGDHSVEALGLNWVRYCSDMVEDFLAHEIKHIRKHCSKPLTTNMHGHLQITDYVKLAKHLDFLSYDSYPRIYGIEDEDIKNLYYESLYLDAIRSLKPDTPWYLIESCPSLPQYFSPLRLKRPGVHNMLSLKTVAQGSDSVMYFQWRAGRGSIEKHHGAVIMHDSPTDTRVTREVAEIRTNLDNINQTLGSTIKSDVALIFDTESIHALEHNHGGPTAKQYREEVLKHYRALARLGINCDVIDQTADFSRYKFITAPIAYALQPSFATRIHKFVSQGGHFLTTFWSGITDQDLCISAGGRLGPLRDILGITSEEIDCLREDERILLEAEQDWLPPKTHSSTYSELVHASHAHVLASYATEFYAGRPALTLNYLGDGRAYYQAAALDLDTLRHFYNRLLTEAELTDQLADIQNGVLIKRRSNSTNEFLFAVNFMEDPCEVSLPTGDWHDLENNLVGTEVPLDSYQVAVFTQSCG
ncbi:beta-galactosidase [Planctomycetota bacterium]|nr:beta-galactosidase [Planctomycetota bacterium]